MLLLEGPGGGAQLGRASLGVRLESLLDGGHGSMPILLGHRWLVVGDVGVCVGVGDAGRALQRSASVYN